MPHTTKRLVRTMLLPLVALIGGSLLLVGCGRGEAAAQQGPTQRPAAAVTAVPAITQDVPVYLDAIGKTVSVHSVSVIPQVGGKIIATHVDDGAYVTKGQLLFEIDDRPFKAAFDAANATLAQAEGELLWAQADFERTKELKSTNVVSPLEYDQKRSALAVVEAKIEAAKAAIETTKLDLEYTKIYSPITGRAGARLVDAGNVVKADDRPLLMIQQLDPIYAEFTVTENDLGTVRKFLASRGMEVGKEAEMGLKVRVDVPGDSSQVISALGATPAATQPATRPAAREGVLTFLDNTVQSNTGTVRLRATVPNSDRYFWPGQFVNTRVVLTTRKDAVLIPAQAQQIGQQGPFVYVVTPGNTAELRLIKPGQRQPGDLLVVESGVVGGERVIVTGQMSVAPGAQVRVVNQPQTAMTQSMTKDETRMTNQ